MTERIWLLKQCILFERLTLEQLSRLESRARARTFPRGSTIYLPSDLSSGVYVLTEGRIRLSNITPEGKQAILAFIEPGELFGEMALVDGGAREEHAEAILSSTVVLLPTDELEKIIAESPKLALGVTKFIGWRRQRVERRLRNLLFRSNRDRLIHLLLELAEKYGRETNEGVLIDLKLSHQDLASIIGSTRESVTLLLGELQLDGHLRISRQKVVIRRIDGLAHCVGVTIGEADGGPMRTKATSNGARDSGAIIGKPKKNSEV